MAACHHRPAMDFTAIEAIMPTQPDSALVLLDTLHTDPNDFTAKDRAHYYLLLTEAMDRCYLTHTTDSLIRLSADYYAAHHDNSRYAKALSGRVGRIASIAAKSIVGRRWQAAITQSQMSPNSM